MVIRRMLRKKLDEPTKHKALTAIEQIRRERDMEQQNISATEELFGCGEWNDFLHDWKELGYCFRRVYGQAAKSELR